MSKLGIGSICKDKCKNKMGKSTRARSCGNKKSPLEKGLLTKTKRTQEKAYND